VLEGEVVVSRVLVLALFEVAQLMVRPLPATRLPLTS
jgi:hypothetical protein